MSRVLRALGAISLVVTLLSGVAQGVERPYEMVWANRTADEFPPLARLEDAEGWRVDCCDAEASVSSAADRVLFGKGVLRLRYRATGSSPRVRLAPVKPLTCPVGFDTVSIWIYGNRIWGKDDLVAEFRDADGVPFALPLDPIRHLEWHCQLAVLPPELRPRAVRGATFEGFSLAIETNTAFRTLDFTSLCVFRDPQRPLPKTVRARRGVQIFADQPQGHNTGTGRLPFPNRAETVIPPRREVKGLEFRLPRDGALDWRDLAFRVDGGDWIALAEGGGLFPAEKARGARVRFRREGNSVVAEVEAPAGVEEVNFGVAALPANRVLVHWPYYTFTWCDEHDIPGYGNGGACTPRTATFELNGRRLCASAMFDWTQSSAFAPTCREAAKNGLGQLCCGVKYVPKTDGSWNRVYERFVWTVAERTADVFPSLPNPESPWKKVTGSGVWRSNPAKGDRSANRDYWRKVKALGIDHLIVTDHETGWRDGNESFTYRTRTAPAKGGDDGQRAYARFMIDEMGFRYGPYTGLSDFSAINGHWSVDRISRRWNGAPVTTWQRCYAPKSTWAVEMGTTLPPVIQRKFAFNTAYCDVHTCNAPWNRGDCDARAPGAATFAQTFYDYGEIMLLQKATWNGPVYSEGGFHWWYCGLADGNYAQDYTYAMNDDPWLVDFDLARLHDKCCNFGMGAPNMFYRGSKRKPDPRKEREEYLMRFIAATLAFGHPGYLVCVNEPISVGFDANDLECEEVSYFLVQGIAAKYTQVAATAVAYADDRGVFHETDAAFLNGAWTRSQVRVTYADGTEVVVNGHRTEMLSVMVGGASYVLPPNGWVAVSGDGKAGSYNAIRDGVRCQHAWSEEYDYWRRDGMSTFSGKKG